MPNFAHKVKQKNGAWSIASRHWASRSLASLSFVVICCASLGFAVIYFVSFAIASMTAQPNDSAANDNEVK